MKKLLLGCIAAVAALMALSGCDQDKVAYNGPSYLMFSDTLYNNIAIGKPGATKEEVYAARNE